MPAVPVLAARGTFYLRPADDADSAFVDDAVARRVERHFSAGIDAGVDVLDSPHRVRRMCGRFAAHSRAFTAGGAMSMDRFAESAALPIGAAPSDFRARRPYSSARRGHRVLPPPT